MAQYLLSYNHGTKETRNAVKSRDGYLPNSDKNPWQSIKFKMTHLYEESNSMRIHTINPIVFQDTLNFRDLNHNSNYFSGLFIMMDRSIGFQTIQTPLNVEHIQTPNVRQESIYSSERESSLDSVFSINGRQKLSSLARKVKKTIDRMQTGTTKDVAKHILGDDTGKEMSKKGRHQIRKIKRRIYDVLNVLEAVDDITKNEKTVRKTERLDQKAPNQLQLDTIRKLKRELQEKKNAISIKEKVLISRRQQQRSLNELNQRNRQANHSVKSRIYLPFITVLTSEESDIDIKRVKKSITVQSTNQLRALGDLNALEILFNREEEVRQHI